MQDRDSLGERWIPSLGFGITFTIHVDFTKSSVFDSKDVTFRIVLAVNPISLKMSDVMVLGFQLILCGRKWRTCLSMTKSER